MTIHIEALTFNTIIGLLDFERVEAQKVIIDAKIEYHYEEEQFINYAELIALIETQIQEKKYKLLETALNELGENIIFHYPLIKNLYLKITKPNIIPHANVALSKDFLNPQARS